MSSAEVSPGFEKSAKKEASATLPHKRAWCGQRHDASAEIQTPAAARSVIRISTLPGREPSVLDIRNGALQLPLQATGCAGA